MNIKSIFLHHVMKTGGRAVSASVMQACLDLARSEGVPGLEDIDGPKMYILANSGVFQTIGPWTLNAIDATFPFRATHVPAWYHKEPAPPGHIQITTLRSPLARLISFYRDYVARPDHGSWNMFQCDTIRGLSWREFVEKAPQQVLCHQTFMFSKNLDPAEAAFRISKLDLFWRMEEMEQGLVLLAPMMGIPSIPSVKFGEALPNPTAQELLADYKTVEKAIERLTPDFKLLTILESVCSNKKE